MSGHMIKKVYMWLPLNMQLNFIYCTPYRYSSCFTVYGRVQPQACPTMLLASD